MDNFNPKRLALARRRRGLTKDRLATVANVSIRSIKAYESGDNEPSEFTLARMAKALDFPVEFFTGPELDEPPIEGSSFRAMSRLTQRQRDKALASGALALALSDWIEDRFDLPAPDVPTYQGVDTPETAAIAVRDQWGLGELAVGNMVHTLESHGVRVFSLSEDTVTMDAFSFWRGDKPYVFLNSMKSSEKSRFDAAHELGHLVLHWRGGAYGRDGEREADQFASAFLMPRASVIAEAPKIARLDQIQKAKQTWKVSAPALVYRMHKVGLLTAWEYRMLFQEMSKKGLRKEEEDGIPAETSQVLGKVFRALRDQGVSKGQLATELRIWPDELDRIVFGLVLTPLSGAGVSEATPNAAPPNLRVVNQTSSNEPQQPS